MPTLSTQESEALQALLGAISDPDRVLALWRNKDLFVGVGEDGIRITLGSASSDASTVAERYQSVVGRPLDPLLRAFLEVHDGMNVEATEDGKATIVVDGNPDCTNGLLAARHLESAETSDGEQSGLLIGKAYHQERILLVEDGPAFGSVVFDDADGAPVVLAANMATFFHELSAHGLSVEATVEAVRR